MMYCDVRSGVKIRKGLDPKNPLPYKAVLYITPKKYFVEFYETKDEAEKAFKRLVCENYDNIEGELIIKSDAYYKVN